MQSNRSHRTWWRTGAQRFAGLLVLLLLLAGCNLHHVNVVPAPLKGVSANADRGTGEDPGSEAEMSWWTGLNDARLDALIRQALTDNFDVLASRERINQALAMHRRAGAELWPQLDMDIGFDREVYAQGRERLGTRRQAGVSARWEPDLFGGYRRSRQARAFEVRARIFEAEDFRLNLSVSVAEVYFGIVEQRWLLAVLNEQMSTANSLGRIIGQRYAEGLISNLDVLQHQTQVAELESQIPVANAVLQDLQNQLGALLGAWPTDGPTRRIGENTNFPVIGALVRVDRADELLRRRPDLRAAQATLVAADAATAQALSERLPRLTLIGDAFRVEGRVPGVTAVSLGAGLVQPLLDWGALRSEWVRARAVYRERLAAFSQLYLRAVWEVEALIQNEGRQRELLESLDRRRALLDATIKQARGRYDAGLTDYLPVLSATQQLHGVEQRLVRERRRLTSLRIALHRALGGPV